MQRKRCSIETVWKLCQNWSNYNIKLYQCYRKIHWVISLIYIKHHEVTAKFETQEYCEILSYVKQIALHLCHIRHSVTYDSLLPTYKVFHRMWNMKITLVVLLFSVFVNITSYVVLKRLSMMLFSLTSLCIRSLFKLYSPVSTYTWSRFAMNHTISFNAKYVTQHAELGQHLRSEHNSEHDRLCPTGRLSFVAWYYSTSHLDINIVYLRAVNY